MLGALEETEVKKEEAGEDTKGVAFIDSRNGFKKLFRIPMLCTVRHHWLLGEIFALNCSCHKALLVVHQPAALFHIIMIREGFTQGYPLLMVLYQLSLLPLVEAMKEADPGVLQPWYTDDAAVRGTASQNYKLLHALMENVPYHGYFLEP